MRNYIIIKREENNFFSISDIVKQKQITTNLKELICQKTMGLRELQ